MCAVHSTREEPPPLQCRTTSTRVFRRACSTRWIHSFSRSQEQNDVTARLRSEKLNMRCTCCLFMLTLWSAAAGCNNRMPMCIGSFSLHSKWIGLSKRYPNSSVLRRDVESDRLIGNIIFTDNNHVVYLLSLYYQKSVHFNFFLRIGLIHIIVSVTATFWPS